MTTNAAFPYIFIAGIGLIVLALELIRRWLWSRVYRRLNEKVWKAWVPVVDLWTFFRLGRFPGWLALVLYALSALAWVMSIRDTAFVETPLSTVIVCLLALVLITTVVCSLIALYRITRRLALPGLVFLVYLFAGELIWLIVVSVSKPTSLATSTRPSV